MWPSTPKFLRALIREFNSREEAAAFTLTSRARMRAFHSHHDCGGIEEAMTTPLDTWVLGAPVNQTTPFLAWYDVEPESTNLRIIIHYDADPLLPGLWPWTYRSGNRRIRRRRGKYMEFKHAALPLLHEVLDAYRLGDKAVEKIIQQTGHRYWLGRVVPDPMLYQEI